MDAFFKCGRLEVRKARIEFIRHKQVIVFVAGEQFKEFLDALIEGACKAEQPHWQDSILKMAVRFLIRELHEITISLWFVDWQMPSLAKSIGCVPN